MVIVDKLSKSFGHFKALNQVSLKIPDNCIYGLIGPNGAGKSTLIKHLVGSYRQDEGLILINGQNVYDNIEVKRRMVFVPDQYQFNYWDTPHKMRKKFEEIYPFFNEKRYLDLCDKSQFNSHQPFVQMSKGMQKQIMLWLAVSCMPDILILDEPVDGLDPVTRRRLWNLLRDDVRERGSSIIIASHNLRELEDVCDRIGILVSGELIKEKDIDDLKSDLHKIQTSIEEELLVFNPTPEFKVIYQHKVGSVYNYIIKGDLEAVKAQIRWFKPLFIDVLPLTLEEVFIYEIGGEGYDVQEILF